MSDCSFWANIDTTVQVARSSTATTTARLSRRRNKVWTGWKVKRPAPSKSTRGRIIELADPTPLLPRRAIETSAQVGRMVSHVPANHVNVAILLAQRPFGFSDADSPALDAISPTATIDHNPVNEP